MTITKEQERRAIELLDRLTEKEAETILAKERSFVKWLKSVAEDIYLAISSAISEIWNWLRSVFA